MGIGAFIHAAKIGTGLLKKAYEKADDAVSKDLNESTGGDVNHDVNHKVDLDDKVEKTAKVRI